MLFYVQEGLYMYTIKELCFILKVSRGTINAWIAAGKINVVRIGRLVRISEEELERIKRGG